MTMTGFLVAPVAPRIVAVDPTPVVAEAYPAAAPILAVGAAYHLVPIPVAVSVHRQA